MTRDGPYAPGADTRTDAEHCFSRMIPCLLWSDLRQPRPRASSACRYFRPQTEMSPGLKKIGADEPWLDDPERFRASLLGFFALPD